jgi:hypothetical protein
MPNELSMTEERARQEGERISNKYKWRPVAGFTNGTYNYKFIDEKTGKVKAHSEGTTMLEAKINCIKTITLSE